MYVVILSDATHINEGGMAARQESHQSWVLLQILLVVCHIHDVAVAAHVNLQQTLQGTTIWYQGSRCANEA